MAGWPSGWLAIWQADWVVACTGWLIAGYGYLAGCLPAYYLVGWLSGWLAGS